MGGATNIDKAQARILIVILIIISRPKGRPKDKTMAYKITDLKSGISRHVKTPEDVYDWVERFVGMELHPCGMPYCIEVSSWAELACIGEIYEHSAFTVEVVE